MEIQAGELSLHGAPTLLKLEGYPMLEDSKAKLDTAPETERRAAEIIARGFLISQLEQDLIPSPSAHAIVADHEKANDEEWCRAVLGALLGLQLAAAQGFGLNT